MWKNAKSGDRLQLPFTTYSAVQVLNAYCHTISAGPERNHIQRHINWSDLVFTNSNQLTFIHSACLADLDPVKCYLIQGLPETCNRTAEKIVTLLKSSETLLN